MSVEKKTSHGLSDALQEAQSIIEAAEQRAEDLRSKAEVAYREALESGYAEGVEKGRKECADAGIRLIHDSGAIGEKLSEQAAKLAIAITETIIKKSVELDPSIAATIAFDALQESVVGESVTLVVHPEDEPAIKESLPELVKIAGGAQLKIETDETFDRGGVLIRTDFGEVDSRISTMVDSIAERLELTR